jgi:hypothetical protein
MLDEKVVTCDACDRRANRSHAARQGARDHADARGACCALVVLFTGVIAGLQMSGWWAIGIVLALTSVFPEHRK